MLTEESQDVIFFMESINAEQAARANEAMLELKKRIADYFGIEGTAFIVDSEHPEVNS